MGPCNQNFQEYSIHRAPWTMTFTMTCFTLAAERIQAMPQSSLFYSLVSPWPTRSGLPIWCLLSGLTSVCFRLTCLLLQFLGFSVDSQICLGAGSVLHCAARSLHRMAVLTSGPWALHASRSSWLLRQPQIPTVYFPTSPTTV